MVAVVIVYDEQTSEGSPSCLYVPYHSPLSLATPQMSCLAKIRMIVCASTASLGHLTSLEDTIDDIEQPSTRAEELLKPAQAKWGRSPPSSSSKREKEKESGEAWPGPRSSAHANETLLHSEITKIAPADRPPVRPVRGSIACDVSGPLITSSYVREDEIQDS